MKLRVFETEKEAGRYIADVFESALKLRPDPLFGLATGSTVRELYDCFAKDCETGAADFSSARTVNLDEYLGLSADHPQSFSYFMRHNLFLRTNFKKENLYLYDGGGDPVTETARIKAFLDENTIDVMILGVGTNGHIGFNEPDSAFESSPHSVDLAMETIKANSRFFNDESEVPKRAFTIGMRDIVKTKKVILAAFGEGKAKAVKRLFADDRADPQLPCSILNLIPASEVVVDRALAQAAGLE